jgi:hypothetical protein
MTRKDFELIADVISAVRTETDGTVDGILDNLTHKFADVLYGTNPRFNRDRFERAAGVR